MSGTFSGFSEDDINRVKNGGTANVDAIRINKGAIKTTNKGAPQKTVTFKNIANNKKPISKTISKDTGAIPEVFAGLPDAAKLSSPLIPPHQKIASEMIDNSNNKVNENAALEVNGLDQCIMPVDNFMSASEKRFLDLEEFQTRQKLIEEQNRKRKELLSKALADRTKQTQEEAQRLNEIRNEFKKLDAILSNDVSILRKQIEAASLEYLDVEKKYNKIEKEFLEAKLALHQKLERKELLTEHLCAIIEKNEERKAEKLNELLQKLQLDGGVCEDNPEEQTRT